MGLAYVRLAKLKDLVMDLLAGKVCYFCGEPFTNPLQVTTHHINEDHNDNRPENMTPAHEPCHRSYHAKRILHKKNKKRALREVKKANGVRKNQVRKTIRVRIAKIKLEKQFELGCDRMVKQVLLTGQVASIRQPSPQKQTECPNRERLIKIVKKRGKAWAVAALVDGSIGYYSVENGAQIIEDLLAGRSLGGSERCMCCFKNDGVAEIDHDFHYFANKDTYPEGVARVRLLVNYVEGVLRVNESCGRARGWLEQMTESMMYPTRGTT
jgi:hypothetical protein